MKVVVDRRRKKKKESLRIMEKVIETFEYKPKYRSKAESRKTKGDMFEAGKGREVQARRQGPCAVYLRVLF